MHANTLARASDGHNRGPRLAVLQSWWSMSGIGHEGITDEEKFELIAEAGFEKRKRETYSLLNRTRTSRLCHY